MKGPLNDRNSFLSGSNLTPREIEILTYLSFGLTAKEVATLLYISTETVHTHRTSMKTKLAARNTAHLISRSYQKGVLIIK